MVHAPCLSNTAVIIAKAAARVTKPQTGSEKTAVGTFLSNDHLLRHDVACSLGDLRLATRLDSAEQLPQREAKKERVWRFKAPSGCRSSRPQATGSA